MAQNDRVRITWNNAGGPLASQTVVDDGELSVSKALVEMIRATPVCEGDTFTVELAQ